MHVCCRRSDGHILHCLSDIAAGVARTGIVQTANEVVSVGLGEGHECATHDDEFYLVYIVSKLF